MINICAVGLLLSVHSGVMEPSRRFAGTRVVFLGKDRFCSVILTTTFTRARLFLLLFCPGCAEGSISMPAVDSLPRRSRRMTCLGKGCKKVVPSICSCSCEPACTAPLLESEFGSVASAAAENDMSAQPSHDPGHRQQTSAAYSYDDTVVRHFVYSSCELAYYSSPMCGLITKGIALR